MAREPRPEPPSEGGSKRVVEIPADVPKEGRSVGQVLAAILTVLVVLAGALWILVPILS